MATQQTPAAAVENELKVSWDDASKKLVVESTSELWQDQYVRCTNATGYDAELILTFAVDSPFTAEPSPATIKQDEVRKLLRNGRFTCDCTLKSHGKETTSKQGGVVVVKP